MNKELQMWVAENEDLEEDEISYAILDALAPLLIYRKLAPQASLHVINDIKIDNIDDSTQIPEVPKFLCDKMCANIDDELASYGYESILIDNENYKGEFFFLIFLEIIERLSQDDNRILVTTDKYLANSSEAPNRFAYRSKKKFMKRKQKN